ncbi:MAG: NAD(P)/FAD-dependent oxidoreductase [Desulfovibrionaceae bacterium]
MQSRLALPQKGHVSLVRDDGHVEQQHGARLAWTRPAGPRILGTARLPLTTSWHKRGRYVLSGGQMEGVKRPRVVIVGAGFAGLWAAKRLAGSQADVLVVDRNNYHTFFPLLYQVAAAEVEPEQIAYPVRGIFRRKGNVDFTMGEVCGVDFDHRTVTIGDRRERYDYLMLATGSVSHFFGVRGADEHAFQLKELEQAIALRNHLLHRFELATAERDPATKRRLLTVAVVGGGPTGVEYAGALAELIAGALSRDFPSLNLADVTVTLLEGGSGLLPGFPDHLRGYARERLESMGVTVRLGAQVAEVTPRAVLLANGESLPTETVVWTAGVRGSLPASLAALHNAPAGKVGVAPTLQLPDRPEVFVAGDLCGVTHDGAPLPMIAPVAIQQGDHVGRSIKRLIKGKPVKPFRYRDKGTMATIGRKAAVVRLGKREFSGFAAWCLWLVVHLMYLVGFRNRLIVLTNWTWDYFLFERGVRLILPKQPPRPEC